MNNSYENGLWIPSESLLFASGNRAGTGLFEDFPEVVVVDDDGVHV